MAFTEFNGDLDAEPSSNFVEFDGKLDEPVDNKKKRGITDVIKDALGILNTGRDIIVNPSREVDLGVMGKYTPPIPDKNAPQAPARHEIRSDNGKSINVHNVDGLGGVLETGFNKGLSQFSDMRAGIYQAIGDATGSDNFTELAQDVQNKARIRRDGTQLVDNQIDGFSANSVASQLPSYASDALGSTIGMAPVLAAGVVNPAAALPSLFGTSVASEYGTGRAAQQEVGDALKRALNHGAFEVAGGAIGKTTQLSAAIRGALEKNGIANAGKAIATTGALEIPSEEFTYLGQSLFDKYSNSGLNKDMTFDEWLKGAKDTAIVSAIQGGGMTAAGTGLSAVAKRYGQDVDPQKQTVEANAENPVDYNAILDALNKAKEASSPNPPVEPVADPVRPHFNSPHEERVAAHLKQADEHGDSESIKQRYMPKEDKEKVTGFNKAEEQIPTIERAREFVAKHGGTAHYISADIANLGGINAHFENDEAKANIAYRALSDIFADEMSKTGGDVVMVRQGGDEISSVVVGASNEAIEKALAATHARGLEYSKTAKLDKIPYGKRKDDPTPYGTGIYLGYANIAPTDEIADIISRSSVALNEGKNKGINHVGQIESGVNSLVQPVQRGRRGLQTNDAAESTQIADGNRRLPEQEHAGSKRAERASGNLIQRIKQLGGISQAAMRDITGESSQSNIAAKGLFSQNGRGLDELATALAAEGFPINLNDIEDNGGVNQLSELVKQAVNGGSVLSYAEQEARNQKSAEIEHNDRVRAQAKELGIKTVARKMAAINADVVARLEKIAAEKEAALREEVAQYEELDLLIEELRAIAGDDGVSAAVSAAYEAAGDAAGTEQVRRLIASIRRETNQRIQNVENAKAGQSTQEAARESDRAVRDQSNTGTNQESESSAEGQQAAPELTLTGQTNAEIAAKEQAAQDTAAEDKAAADLASEVPLTLATQSQDKADTPTVQAGMFTPDGRPTQAAEVDTALFSLGDSANSSGVDLATTNSVIDRVLASKKGWNVEVAGFDSFDTLLAEVKEAAASQYGEKSARNAKGITHKGKVYIISSNNESAADVEQTILHEVEGHIGVHRLYGTELVRKLNDLYTAIGGLDGLKKIVEQRGITGDIADYATILDGSKTLNDEQKLSVIMDEVLAHYAEHPKFGDKVKEIIGAIRKWLRDNGFAKLAKYGETDLLQILKQGRSQLKKAGKGENATSLRVVDVATSKQQSKTKMPRNTDIISRILPKSVPLIYSRDEKGNIRSDFLGTRRGKDFINAAFTRPMAVKMGMASATPELAKMIRSQKASIDKAMRQAANVIKSMEGMTEEEAALISRIVTKEMYANDVPPEHALKIAAVIEQAMTEQGQEAVDLQMLSPDSYQKWKGKYLPRMYMRHLDPEFKNVWARTFKSKAIDGFRSGSLKGRGKRQVIDVADLPEWEALGWTQDGKEAKGTVPIWKDYTQDERKDMGEVEDVRLRFVMGYLSMQRDISVGRMYKRIAENSEWARRTDAEGFTYVPETEIPDTGGLKRYGSLSGMYVKKEILVHISQYEQNDNEFQKYYKAALSKWKEGKTVLNPVTHMNNFVSNVTNAHFAGVSYWDGEKYLLAMKDLYQNSDMVKEAEDAGLFTGGFSHAEIMKGMPPEIRKMVEKAEDGAAIKAGRTIWQIASLGLNDKAAMAYQWGDSLFSYVIYRDARSKGMSPEDAVYHAGKYVFKYDDLPSAARGIRDYVIPFFAYTYKVVPMLINTAIEYPWRFAAPAAAVASINALVYGALAGDAEDDDWWLTAITNGTMNALLNAYTLGIYGEGEAKTKGQKLEQSERKNLPEWDMGASALGTQKTIRMGTDEKTGLPVFLNVYRFMPGGDIQDVQNEKGGLGIPAPLMPSNPLWSAYSALYDNRNWDGKEVFDKNDTAKESAIKTADFIYKQIFPAIAPGGSHYDRILNGAANYFDTTIESAHPLKDYTGIGKDGLPAQAKYAAMQTIGIKAKPVDLELSAEFGAYAENSKAKGIIAEIKRARRLFDKGAMSEREYDGIYDAGIKKIDLIKEAE